MKSVLDCIRAARDTRRKRRDEAIASLREAEAYIEHLSSWIDLAEAWVELGPAGHADARRCVERALAEAGDDVSIVRGAAKVYGRGLADPDAARRMLDRCIALCEPGPRFGASEWCNVAWTCLWAVDDRDRARVCLARAIDCAPSLDELCKVAGLYGKELGELDTARALIERADALLAAGADDGTWSLANAQRHTLGDAAAAWRTFERALERAADGTACLRLAPAIASHVESEPARRPLVIACLAKAETFATSATHWIAAADAWHEHRGTRADVRRCLERALAADPDAEARAKIAHGHRHWLDDAATADALAPRGIAPAALVSRRRRLDGWDADPAALLDWLRPRLSPKALREIALADYGSDVDKHLAPLVDVQATGLIPQPLDWYPREVLELRRWSQDAGTDHVARAFVCTVLLLDFAGPTYRDGHEQTLPVLIESCLALGDDALAHALGLLVAVAESIEDFRHELPFAYLGVLVAAAARDPRDPRLPRLAETLIAAAAAASGYGADVPRPDWLLDQTNFDARHRLWRRLAAQHLGAPAAADPSLTHLADIAARLRSD